MASYSRSAWRLLSSDRGDSFVEILLSVTLIGIAFSALLGGLSNMNVAAQRHNENAQAEALLSQAKQAIGTATYGTCASYSALLPAGVTIMNACATVTGVPTLQQIDLQATAGQTTHNATVFKGDR